MLACAQILIIFEYPLNCEASRQGERERGGDKIVGVMGAFVGGDGGEVLDSAHRRGHKRAKFGTEQPLLSQVVVGTGKY